MLARRLDRVSRSLFRAFAPVFLAVAAVGMIGASNVHALSLDFESLAHGEVAIGSLDGVEISAVNSNRSFDLAVGFDTLATGTADLDLEQAGLTGTIWSGGNIAEEQLGMILILQENDSGCEAGTGICSNPDDEGRRPAGEISFAFEQSVLDFGFDLVDVDSAMAEAAFIDLYDGDAVATVALADFVDSGSDRYDASIVLGNNSANRFAAITAESVGLAEIDAVTIRLGGSGGIDNLTGTIVPEPATAFLLGLGLATLATRRRV